MAGGRSARDGRARYGTVVPSRPLRDRRDLSLAYTPGVAEVSRAIAADPELLDVYTGRGNTVAVVSDGTAVLGLGDIGPGAALPVMEGKAMLFKHFAGIDAVPICLATTDVHEIVETVVRLAPTFGGVNLEDISAPRCFEIERLLQDRLDLPVFHDDQHGTAVVALAALRNAALVVGKDLETLRVVIGVSGGGVPEEIVATMSDDAIVFALANPTPEIHPDVAHKYAAVVGTGRSDFPNQINNVLAFPGIFRGALDVRATRVTEGMKLAAAAAIAACVDEPTAGEVVPSVFDDRIAGAVAAAVAAAARADGVARR